MQTDKECAWGRPWLLLVKHQGWGFTLRSATQRLRRAEASLRGIFRENNFIKFAYMQCGGCEGVAEGGCIPGCCVGWKIDVRSRRGMQRVTVRTKWTRVGHAAWQCRGRCREPIFEGKEPPPRWLWPVKEDTKCVGAPGYIHRTDRTQEAEDSNLYKQRKHGNRVQAETARRYGQGKYMQVRGMFAQWTRTGMLHACNEHVCAHKGLFRRRLCRRRCSRQCASIRAVQECEYGQI